MTTAQNPLTPETITLNSPSSNIATPERVLAIGAHPDDIDFGCGATLAKWTDTGCDVDVIVCTDGSKGTWDDSMDRAELVRIRQNEQRASARRLGVQGEVIFLGEVDGHLTSSVELRSVVTAWIRKLRPTVVLGHDPWKRYRLHPDHRNAGWLVTDAVVAARDATFFPELGLAAHRPELILLWEADQPDHFEDVEGQALRKYEALAEHKSQYASTMSRGEDPSTDGFFEAVEQKLTEAGRAAGLAAAEVFKLIDDL